MSAPKRASMKRNASLDQRGESIWLHPGVARNSSVPLPHVNFVSLAQKLQPHLDQILSLDKKKHKRKRKPTWGEQHVKRQRPVSSYPRTRTSKPPLAPRMRKARPSGQRGLSSSPPEDSSTQQLNDSMPDSQQFAPHESIQSSPPSDAAEVIHTDVRETEIMDTSVSEPEVESEEQEAEVLETTIDEPEWLEEEELEDDTLSDPDTPPATIKSLAPQTVAVLKNEPVVYPRIPFMEKQDGSYVLVSLLEEIWDVEWEHPVSIRWGRKWSELRYEIEVDVKDIRHDQNRLILWISGDILLTRIGTSIGDLTLHHEKISIPFASTILHPTIARSYEEKSNFHELPPYHDKVWTESGDWKAMLIANPSKMATSETQECDGFIHITGRIWWFRKQLLPLNRVQEENQA